MADPTLLEAIDQVSREKGLNRQVLVETMEAAILKAAQAAFGLNRELEARPFFTMEFIQELEDLHLSQTRDILFPRQSMLIVKGETQQYRVKIECPNATIDISQK